MQGISPTPRFIICNICHLLSSFFVIERLGSRKSTLTMQLRASSSQNRGGLSSVGSPFRKHEDDCSVFIELGRAASKRYNFGATKAFKGLLQEFLRARTAPVIERAAVGILLRLNNGNAAVKSAFFRAPGCQTPDLPLMPKVLPPFGPDRVALSHRFNHAGIWPGTLSLSINNTQAHATVGLEEVRMLEAERHRLILKLLGERSVVSI